MKAKMCVICFSGSVGLNKYKLITMTSKPLWGQSTHFKAGSAPFSFRHVTILLHSVTKDCGNPKSPARLAQSSTIWSLIPPSHLNSPWRCWQYLSHLRSGTSQPSQSSLILDVLSDNEMKQNPMALPPMSSACLLSVEKPQPKNTFNQRSENMKKQRKIVKGDQIIIMSSLSKVKDPQFLLKGCR